MVANRLYEGDSICFEKFWLPRPCWPLSQRVKGMGGHTVERLQAEGLAVGPAGAAANPQAAASAQTKGAAAAGNGANTATSATTQKSNATVAVKK